MKNLTMKRLIYTIIFFLGFTLAFSQKIAYIDSEYILNSIPEFISSQEEIDELSKQWEEDIQAQYLEIERMYQAYQTEKYLLPEDKKKQLEEDIILKEQEVNEQKKNLFGPNGKIYEKQKELIIPIQDLIYNAIQEYAEQNDYDIIFDKSSELIMLYYNEEFNVSNQILDQLGYTY
tara:strand:- start:90 stop:617 length:528 start_codon:yes stop_codon:yes gene_type:complete